MTKASRAPSPTLKQANPSVISRAGPTHTTWPTGAQPDLRPPGGGPERPFTILSTTQEDMCLVHPRYHRIGTSAGGVEALQVLVKDLPARPPRRYLRRGPCARHQPWPPAGYSQPDRAAPGHPPRRWGGNPVRADLCGPARLPPAGRAQPDAVPCAARKRTGTARRLTRCSARRRWPMAPRAARGPDRDARRWGRGAAGRQAMRGRWPCPGPCRRALPRYAPERAWRPSRM